MNYFSHNIKQTYLIKLFKEFVQVLEDTNPALPNKTSYNFTENTLTGHLAVAAGRISFPNLLEYRSKQNINNEIHRAKGDMYLIIPDGPTFRIEAKLVPFCDILGERIFSIIKEKTVNNKLQIKQYKLEVCKKISRRSIFIFDLYCPLRI